MPTHRIAFHFVDESPADRAVWMQWIQRAEPVIQSAATLGERRPSIQIAAPFAHRHPNPTTRADEIAGLEMARNLVNALVALASSTGRSIAVLFSARLLGVITAAGAAAAIEEKLAAWEALVAARPPDEPSWEREGFVSIWAGVLPRAEFERLLDEDYENDDQPISLFARDLGITFYDHDNLESSHVETRRSLRDAVAELSFAASFIDLLPADARELQVDTVILMFGADFTGRATAVARKRLRFVGALPYSPETR